MKTVYNMNNILTIKIYKFSKLLEITSSGKHIYGRFLDYSFMHSLSSFNDHFLYYMKVTI
jgi:hypothetical protein